MKSIDFCQWLLGSLNLTDNAAMTPAQVEIIQKHLAMVFVYEIDPLYGSKQKELNLIHQGNLSGSLNQSFSPGMQKDYIPLDIQTGYIEGNPATNPLTDVPMDRQGLEFAKTFEKK